MNKDEFQKNRQIFRMLSHDMFNQMNNMYDQLSVADNRIKDAKLEGFNEGYAEGYKRGYMEGIAEAVAKLQEIAHGERKEE